MKRRAAQRERSAFTEHTVLRQMLQAMTEIEDVTQHPALLQNILAIVQHSVRIVPSQHPINRYTCMMHVFDFTEKPEYIAIADYGLGRIFAGADFAHWLIENELLTEVPNEEAESRNLVVYFRDHGFKHIGLLQADGRVLSKWGIGHLYDHELLDVPQSYGTEVKYYRGMLYDDAFDVFTQFAEENGIPFGNPDP